MRSQVYVRAYSREMYDFLYRGGNTYIKLEDFRWTGTPKIYECRILHCGQRQLKKTVYSIADLKAKAEMIAKEMWGVQ